MIDIYILAEELDGRAVHGATRRATDGGRGAAGRHGGRGATDAGDDPPRLNLSSVRLCPDDLAAYEPDCIYLIDAADIGRTSTCPAGTTFAIAGVKYQVEDELTCDCLLLPWKYSVLDGLAAIQRVFERYERLGAALVEAASKSRGIGSVFELCGEVLANPLALFDSSFSLVAHAGSPKDGASDHIWNDVLSRGYSPVLISNRQMRELEESEVPLVFTIEGVDTLQVCIHVDDRPVAFLAGTALNGPFTDGQVSVVSWIGHAFETLWPLIMHAKGGQGSVAQIMLQAAHGASVDHDVAQRALKQRDWGIDDAYQLLFFYRPSATLETAERGPLCRELAGFIPLALIAPSDHGIMAAVHLREGAPAPESPPLEEALASHDLLGAASEPVEGFLNLDVAFKQCRAVQTIVENRGAVGRTATMTRFSSIYLDYVVHLVTCAEDPRALVQPEVLTLYHRKNGPEFVHDLRLYLIHGRNLAHAAQALYIHRNTLVYRMGQIEEVLGIDLDEADEQQLFRLYLSSLILEECPPRE